MSEPWAGELVFFSDWSVGVPGDGALLALDSPDAVADHVRTDSLGRYRPLSGARTLPRGWQFTAGGAQELGATIDNIYPLAAWHSRQHADGTLRVVSLDDVLTRQSGRYETTSELSPAGRDRAANLVCGECVRVPVWRGEQMAPTDIPCPEPCSVLVAFCREAALWQNSWPESAAPNPTTAWAAFEEPGNELRERYLMEGPLPS